MQERAFANRKIEFQWDSVVTELRGKQRLSGVEVTNVITGATDVLPLSGLFVAIGHRPSTAIFAGQLDMDEAGYILPPTAPIPTWKASSRAETLRTTSTARPSRRLPPDAWLRSTSNAGWRPNRGSERTPGGHSLHLRRRKMTSTARTEGGMGRQPVEG